ncbi:dimethylsulfonioproprionate lyase family protein [Taklimakanibacter lacteus]|uniref:dimethylsulfonioproprionate lyase family protein n=1 Tax=Taklimakanibacter lacteus TaxID=2268456 RepID=UPI000E6668BE
MTERSKVLQDFLDSVHDVLKSAKAGPEAGKCIARVFDALERPSSPGRNQPTRLPACTHLPVALETARSGGPSLARIATSFAALEPQLTWTRRPKVDGSQSDNFADGHANAMIIGPNGLEPREDVWVGVSLLAPHVRYPDHDHSPEEVYLVLSKGRFQHGDSEWFEPGIGGSFYNTPNIKHAMASGDEPLFAIWCLAS